jgi:AraC-like DNA-binding protein
MDVLSSTLLSLQPKGARYYPSEMSAPWGFSTPEGPASYHVMLEGSCRFEVGGLPPVDLHAGDVAVTPSGAACRFRSDADALTPPITALRSLVGDDGVLRRDGEGPVTQLMCGTIDFDLAVPHPLLDALPDRVVVRSIDCERSPWLKHTLDAIAFESRCNRPGAAAAMSYLACVLFVRIIRVYLDRHEPAAPGLVRALRDPYVAPSVDAIHNDPAAGWTVERLAETAGLSRSAYAERFTEVMGEPPMEYVTRWRMREAARLLRTGNDPLAVVADRVGYGSAASFGRRFKQEVGITPGGFREAGVNPSIPV